MPDAIVEAENDAPVFTSIANQIIDEDTSIDIILNAEDPDQDNLEYTVIQSDNIEADIYANILSLTPDLNYSGTTTIFLSVSDGELIDYIDFTLTVNAVNDAPIL